jgi:hypothetical protein
MRAINLAAGRGLYDRRMLSTLLAGPSANRVLL